MLRPEGPLRGQRVLVTAGPDLRGRRSGALHRQPIERPDGLRDCGRGRAPRRRGDARRRADGDRAAGGRARSCACAAPPRCTSAVHRRAPTRGRRGHGGRGRRLHAGRARRAEGGEGRRHADARAEEDAGHPRRPRAAAAGDRATGRCSSASPPKPRTSSRARRRSASAKHVDLIVANDVSRADAGFDVDTNAVTIVGADGAGDAAAAAQGARRRGDPRSRRAAARSQAHRRQPSGRQPDLVMDRDQLAEHLRFAAELGVAGVSRDPAWRRARRIRCRTSVRPRRAGRRDSATVPPLTFAQSGRGAGRDPRRHRRLHALQAAHARPHGRSCSASAIRTPT